MCRNDRRHQPAAERKQHSDVIADERQPDAAQALVKFMSSPEAAPLIRKSGMKLPPR